MNFQRASRRTTRPEVGEVRDAVVLLFAEGGQSGLGGGGGEALDHCHVVAGVFALEEREVHLGVEDGQVVAFDAPGEFGVAFGEVEGLVVVGVGVGDEGGGEVRRGEVEADAVVGRRQFFLILYGDVLQALVVSPDGLGGLAEVAGDEVVGELLPVERGVPHQVGDDPGAQEVALGADGVGGEGAFGHDTFGAVFAPEADVVGGEAEAGVGHQEVVVVHVVVPDVERRLGGPSGGLADYFLHLSRGSQRVVPGVVVAVFDDDVRMERHVFQGLAGLQVGEGDQLEVGVVGREDFGDAVDQEEEGGGGGAFAVVDGGAFGAQAGISAIATRDVHAAVVGFGVRGDFALDARGDDLGDLGVGVAELAVAAAHALFVHREVFGMCVKVFVFREEVREGVGEAQPLGLLAGLGGKVDLRVVDAVVEAPGDEEGWSAEGVAEIQLRGVASADGREGEFGGQPFGVLPPVAVAQVLLKEGVDGVVEAELRAALEIDGVVCIYLDVNAIDAQRVRRQFGRAGGAADAQFRAVLRFGVRNHGEGLAAAAFQDVGEGVGRVGLLRRGRGGGDDAVARDAVRVQQRDCLLPDSLLGLQRVAPFQRVGDEEAGRKAEPEGGQGSFHR